LDAWYPIKILSATTPINTKSLFLRMNEAVFFQNIIVVVKSAAKLRKLIYPPIELIDFVTISYSSALNR
jgi:hypothetical protein